MKTPSQLVRTAALAVSLGIGGAALTSTSWAQEFIRDTTPDTAKHMIEVSDREANNIRGTLSAAVEAALTPGQLRSAVQRMTEADRARLDDVVRQDFAALDQEIERFRQNWEARYDKRFNISDRDAVFDPHQVAIRKGISDEARLAAERIRGEDRGLRMRGEIAIGDQATERRPEAQAEVEVRGERAERPDAQAEAELRAPRPAADAADAQRVHDNQATVVIPAHGDLPELHIVLVNEGTVLDAWRIDAPLSLDGQTLQQNVLATVQKLNQKVGEWPADVNQAYRVVSHAILAALVDADLDGEARQAGDVQDPDARPQAQPNAAPQGEMGR